MLKFLSHNKFIKYKFFEHQRYWRQSFFSYLISKNVLEVKLFRLWITKLIILIKHKLREVLFQYTVCLNLGFPNIQVPDNWCDKTQVSKGL